MFTHLKSRRLLAILALIVVAPLTANAQDQGWPVGAAIQTTAGQTIPAGAFGIVEVDSPRVATLLKLRGVTGRGTITMRSDTSRDCLTLPIRFIAGDFGGDTITTHRSVPIRMTLQSAKISNALARGEDIVSDMYQVSTQAGDATADIIIDAGLSDSHGFVLNPGASVFADVFGAQITHTACAQK